jgi:hypothetical protein
MMNLLVKSAICGMAIGCAPVLVGLFFSGSQTLPAIQEATNYLLFPGIVVSLLASGGRVHDVNRVVIVVSSCIFYTFVFYLILRRRKREVRT